MSEAQAWPRTPGMDRRIEGAPIARAREPRCFRAASWLAVTGILMALCSESDGAPHSDPASGLTFEVEAPLSSAAVCPLTRVVGVRSGETCPVPTSGSGGSWTGGLLFEPSPGQVLPPELARFCVYDWTSPGGTPPDPAALPKDGHPSWSDWLAPDCQVVAAQSSPMMELLWPELEAAYLQQVEALAALPTGAQPAAATRVEVIDSAVTERASGRPSHGALAHGRAVGRIIERLACPGGAGPDCHAFITSTLALRLTRDSTGVVADPANGGFFGSQADLARSIQIAVDRWKVEAPASRFVINLSVGWEPTYGGQFSGTAFASLPGPVRAVHAALAFARCEGALVIAAAGNASGGPAPDVGPLYPAAWETKPAPSGAQCGAFGASGAVPAGGSYAALLYSAGGVDGRDAPLANTRVQGRPRLAAPGAHVLVEDGPEPTMVYTGSSMAAAVVSAAAAAVWSYQPGLGATEVMDLIHASGRVLGTPAHYCLGSSCGSVRRVSVCEAVAAACASTSPRCPNVSFVCPGLPAGRDLRPVALDLDVLPMPEVSARNLLATFTVGPPCRATVRASSRSGPANPCPGEQLYASSARPAVEPQPDEPPCTKCVFAGSTLYLSINPSFSGKLTDATLALTPTRGPPVKLSLADTLGTLEAGDEVKVTDLGFDAQNVERCTIDFLVDGKASVQDQVLVFAE